MRTGNATQAGLVSLDTGLGQVGSGLSRHCLRTPPETHREAVAEAYPEQRAVLYEFLTSDVVIVGASARGGTYENDQIAENQKCLPQTFLGFIGIDDLHFVRVEKTGFGLDTIAAGLQAANEEIASLLSDSIRRAAEPANSQTMLEILSAVRN